ncbi:MAG TPA: type II secretion system protein [bacterium]|nr:type II secretion system protein [bacterium]
MFKVVQSTTLPKALTLLELVVTVALFAILTLSITKLYIQVLSAQDRILDEQNIIADLNYASSVFIDEAKRSALQVVPASGCGDTAAVNCQNKYFCAASDLSKACMMNKGLVRINYYTDTGLFKATRGGSIYSITSSDISFSATKLEPNSSGDQLNVQIKASGDNQYQQEIFYQNYITK